MTISIKRTHQIEESDRCAIQVEGRIARQPLQYLSPAHWVSLSIATTVYLVLFSSLYVIILGLGILLPASAAWGTSILLLLFTLIWSIHLLGYFPPREVATTEVDYPTLHLLVKQVAQQLDVPVPTIIICENFTASFAHMGWRFRPVLILGHQLLAVLDDTEIVTVVAHELGHARDGTITRSPYVRLAWMIVRRLRRLSKPSQQQHRMIDRCLAWGHTQLGKVDYRLTRCLQDDHQIAELVADELALSLSGEKNPARVMQKMLYRHMAEIELAYQQSPAAEKVDAMRAMVARVPEHELERWWRKLLAAPHDLDPMHPPMRERVAYLNARAGQVAKVRISAENSLKLQGELQRWPQQLEKQIDDYLQNKPPNHAYLLSQINIWNKRFPQHRQVRKISK
ncbi:MAG: M48 family metalloprotease [Candidatus Promineifilaceae bacterium]